MPQTVMTDMKRMILRGLVCGGAWLMLALSNPSEAQVPIFDSLQGSDLLNPSGDIVGSNDSGGNNKWAYQFTTPLGLTGNGFNRCDIQAAVFSNFSGNPADVFLSIYDWDSVADEPGASLGDSGVFSTDDPGVGSVITTSIQLNTSLLDSTKYYFVISYPASSSNPNLALAPFSTTVQAAQSASVIVPGGPWNTLPPPPTPPIESGAFSVTAVPEPQAFAMLSGLGLLGLATYRRFRR